MKFELRLDKDLEPPQYVFKAKVCGFGDYVALMEKFRDKTLQKTIDRSVFGKWKDDVEYSWIVFAEIDRSAVDSEILMKLLDRFWVHRSTVGGDNILISYEEDIAYSGDDVWMINYLLGNLESIDENKIKYATIKKEANVKGNLYVVVEWVYTAYDEPAVCIYVDDLFSDVVEVIKDVLKIWRYDVSFEE